MKSPIIHDGKPFDWKAGAEASARVMQPDGSVNWGAAFCADPGVMKCPGCGVFLWQEGRIVECPDCGEAWNQHKRHDDRYRGEPERRKRDRRAAVKVAFGNITQERAEALVRAVNEVAESEPREQEGR